MEDHLVRFQALSGISVPDFFKAFEVHLNSTVVQYGGRNAIHQGVCIMQDVASAFSDNHRRFLDLKL